MPRLSPGRVRDSRRCGGRCGGAGGEIAEAKLQAAVETAVSNASGALYGLEKRLLGRFQREKRDVRAFFLDVAPARKKATDKATGGAGPTGAGPTGAGASTEPAETGKPPAGNPPEGT